jgi:hypothetical protein
MTSAEYTAIRVAVVRRITGRRKVSGEAASRDGLARRVSNAVAAELRKRGELAAEGYAPGSWAKP